MNASRSNPLRRNRWGLYPDSRPTITGNALLLIALAAILWAFIQ